MNARKLLNLYADYLRPRIKMVRPKGYEKPGERRTDIRFQAWLRVVTEPSYPDYESDLVLCLVKCEGDPYKQERIGEFELALDASLIETPFVEPIDVPDKDEAPDSRDALVPLSAAAHACGVSLRTMQRFTDKGMPHDKLGSRYFVNIFVALDWKQRHYQSQMARKRVA